MDQKRKLLSNSVNRSLPLRVPNTASSSNRKRRRILATTAAAATVDDANAKRGGNGTRRIVDEDDDDDDSVAVDEYNSDEEAYYYENDSEDGLITAATVIDKSKREKGSDNDTVSIKLPGAVAVSSKAYASSSPSLLPRDHVPNEISFLVRAYLDVLLGSVAIEKLRLITSGIRQSEYAIPSIVHNVLKYNNIMFEAVTMSDTKYFIPEPLWYDIDIQNRHLHLYLNQDMYNTFCSKMSDTPVTMISGVVPLERYNPLSVHKALKTLDSAMINCAVVCDHVAQHVISEVYENIDGGSGEKSDGADIHERYNRYGTTLHSMLDITLIGNQVQETNQTSNFLTMLGCNNTAAATASASNNISRTTIDDLFEDVSSSAAAPISLIGAADDARSFSYSS